MKTDEHLMHEFDEFMYLNKLAMYVLGIWPLDKKASWLLVVGSKIRLYIVYFFMSVLLCVQWLEMYSMWGNVDVTSETFLSNAFIFAVMVKLSTFVKYADTFRDILHTMRANWLSVMSEAEPRNKDLMYSATEMSRSRSNTYFLVIGATGLLYITMPFLNPSPFRDRKYPFFGRYYFDRDSEVVYLVCYLSQILTGSLAALATYGTDTMFLVCTYHFCAQLQILQNDLMDLGYGDHLDGHSHLISLIKRHQTEIRYVLASDKLMLFSKICENEQRSAQALQSMFSRSSLQQILLSCLMICMNGFQLVVSLSKQDADVVRYLLCLMLTLLQLLFYCQPGNELIIQSQSLDEAIYQSAWISMDKNSIKNHIFMIQRSQRPLAITAGKIYVLSLENFMRIVKTSMSGLSVLQAVYRRDD